MGLDDPAKKDVQIGGKFKNYIALLDSPEIIREKIKSAVTDSENEIKYDAQKQTYCFQPADYLRSVFRKIARGFGKRIR